MSRTTLVRVKVEVVRESVSRARKSLTHGSASMKWTATSIAKSQAPKEMAAWAAGAAWAARAAVFFEVVLEESRHRPRRRQRPADLSRYPILPEYTRSTAGSTFGP